MDFELSLFLQSLPALAKGAVITAELTVVSILIGALIGTIVGVVRVSGRPILSGLAAGYVTLMRGVPLLVTLLFLYYGLPSAGVRLDAFTVAIIALSITSGAYIGEIVRAGLEVMTWQANTFSPFAGVALFYLLLTLPLVWLNTSLEQRYRIH